MSFIHLHNHTRMSLLDGMIDIESLVTHAEKNGGTVAVTDHGWVAAAAKFAQAAKEKSVKPIIGCEFYIVDDATIKTTQNREWWHLILLARTEEGYKNLCRLTSYGYSIGYYYKPRIDKAMLEKYSEGLICLSGCIGSEIPQKFILNGDEKLALNAAKWYQQVFGEHYWIEVQDHAGTVEHVRPAENEDDEEQVVTEAELNSFLVLLSQKLDIGLVATNDAHYVAKSHGEIHDTMLAMQMGTWKGGAGRLRFPGAKGGHWHFYLKSEKEMRGLCKEKWWQSACSATVQVASQVEDNVIRFGKPRMPQFQIPENDPDFKRWLAKRK